MRKLGPLYAFLMSVVGLGYLYVGKLRFGIFVLVGAFLALGMLGWTGWIFQPIGIHVTFTLAAIAMFFHFAYPSIIAWRQKTAPTKRYNRWYFYLVWFIGLQLLAEFVVPDYWRISGFKVFSIPGRGMEPTLEQGDWVVVDTWRYRSREPQVGDIVAFVRDNLMFAKRICGLPGDTIELRNGILFRNGKGASEPYLHVMLDDQPYARDVSPVSLGPDQYYVLGDYRDQSIDSRRLGPVFRQEVLGRAENVNFSHQGWRIIWQRFPKDLTDDT